MKEAHLGPGCSDGSADELHPGGVEPANPNAVARFAVPGYRRYLSATSEPLDLEGQITRVRGFQSAFPDVPVSVEDMVAQWGGPDMLDLVRQLGGSITTEVLPQLSQPGSSR